MLRLLTQVTMSHRDTDLHRESPPVRTRTSHRPEREPHEQRQVI